MEAYKPSDKLYVVKHEIETEVYASSRQDAQEKASQGVNWGTVASRRITNTHLK